MFCNHTLLFGRRICFKTLQVETSHKVQTKNRFLEVSSDLFNAYRRKCTFKICYQRKHTLPWNKHILTDHDAYQFQI